MASALIAERARTVRPNQGGKTFTPNRNMNEGDPIDGSPSTFTGL